jgi:hypothetical protein
VGSHTLIYLLQVLGPGLNRQAVGTPGYAYRPLDWAFRLPFLAAGPTWSVVMSAARRCTANKLYLGGQAGFRLFQLGPSRNDISRGQEAEPQRVCCPMSKSYITPYPLHGFCCIWGAHSLSEPPRSSGKMCKNSEHPAKTPEAAGHTF